jgi:hypothetical protein
MRSRLGDATSTANAEDYNRAGVLVRQGRSDEALPLLEITHRVARAVGDEDLGGTRTQGNGQGAEPAT